MWLLAGYCLFIAIAAYFGGFLSYFGHTTHRIAQILVSLVAGFILGLALFHLLPHGLELIPPPHASLKGMLAAAAGIVALIFILHVFHFHSHESLEQPPSSEFSDAHNHADGQRGGTLFGVLTGLAIHTVMEGVTLGVTVELNMRHYGQAGVLPGLAVFIAIVLHKPLDAYTILFLSKRAGHSPAVRQILNIGFALLCPLVAFLAFWIGNHLGEDLSSLYIGYVLAFAAGAFLCISLSDLLPEIQFHYHDRIWLVIALLGGLLAAIGLFYFEEFFVHSLH